MLMFYFLEFSIKIQWKMLLNVYNKLKKMRKASCFGIHILYVWHASSILFSSFVTLVFLGLIECEHGEMRNDWHVKANGKSGSSSGEKSLRTRKWFGYSEGHGGLTLGIKRDEMCHGPLSMLCWDRSNRAGSPHRHILTLILAEKWCLTRRSRESSVFFQSNRA